MRRKQVQLTDDQMRTLEELAERQKRSVDDVIREGLDTFIAQAQRDRDKLYERALSIIGMCKDGPPDLAENHDEYYAQAIEEHIEENRR